MDSEVEHEESRHQGQPGQITGELHAPDSKDISTPVSIMADPSPWRSAGGREVPVLGSLGEI